MRPSTALSSHSARGDANKNAPCPKNSNFPRSRASECENEGLFVFCPLQRLRAVTNLPLLLPEVRSSRRKLLFPHFVARHGGGVEVAAGMRRL